MCRNRPLDLCGHVGLGARSIIHGAFGEAWQRREQSALAGRHSVFCTRHISTLLSLVFSSKKMNHIRRTRHLHNDLRNNVAANSIEQKGEAMYQTKMTSRGWKLLAICQ